MKKDGGICPIAVGNIIRRLTAKCFSHALADKSSAFFQPYQMGVAVRGGLESLIHTTRQIVEVILYCKYAIFTVTLFLFGRRG